MKFFINITVLLLALFIGAGNINAQANEARKHLYNLKNGVLLVKLYTRKPVVEALRESGRDERANNIKREQDFKNLLIVRAFENRYDFSPRVYFYYSDDSQKVMDREFEDVLMGYDLQKLSNVKLDSNFYIAEFGNTEGMDINALVVKDNQYNDLESPFPYFVRTYEGLWLLSRSYDRVVELWNEKLREADARL